MTLDQLDSLAASMERKWGVDRLPGLMPTAWRAKFDALRESLDNAIIAGTSTAEPAAALALAWRKMDEKATEQGSFPLDPKCLELRKDGQIFAIALDAETARACFLGAQWEQRQVSVYLADALLDTALANPTLRAVHATFPGATVTTQPAAFRPGKRAGGMPEDEIPFGGEDAA